MHFVISNNVRVLSLLSLTALSALSPAVAQGLMEYGGLMAAPKGIPSQNTIDHMTRGWGVVPSAIPGATQINNVPGRFDSPVEAEPGKPLFDAKKSKIMLAKATEEYKQAKAILSDKSKQNTASLKLAESLMRDAVAVHNTLWGYADPTIPVMLNQLGQLYELQKQSETALSCYKSALVYINKRFGPGSPERLDTLEHMSALAVKDDNLKEALGLQQQIALIKERKKGIVDPSTIEAKLTWASTAKALDKPEAADIYKKCLTDINQAGEKINPEVASKYKSEIVPVCVSLLKKQGREEEAREIEARESSANVAAPPAAVPAAADKNAASAQPAITK